MNVAEPAAAPRAPRLLPLPCGARQILSYQRAVGVRKGVPVDLGRLVCADRNRHVFVGVSVVSEDDERPLVAVPDQRDFDTPALPGGQVYEVLHDLSVIRQARTGTVRQAERN